MIQKLDRGCFILKDIVIQVSWYQTYAFKFAAVLERAFFLLVRASVIAVKSHVSVCQLHAVTVYSD